MGLTDLIEISDFLGDFVINNLRVRVPLRLSQFMKDKNKDYLYYCWEADSNGDPTGKEKYLRSKSKRNCIKHLQACFGGETGTQKILLRLPNGNIWCATCLENQHDLH